MFQELVATSCKNVWAELVRIGRLLHTDWFSVFWPFRYKHWDNAAVEPDYRETSQYSAYEYYTNQYSDDPVFFAKKPHYATQTAPL